MSAICSQIMISCELNLQAVQRRKRAISPSSTSTVPNMQETKSRKDVSEYECKSKKTGCFCENCLYLQLSLWSISLLKLQPKVYMAPRIIQCCVCLFKRVCEKKAELSRLGGDCFGQNAHALLTCHDKMLKHDLIACWWIAMKHCSFRTAMPNRTLISRATGASDTLLADCEVKVLKVLDWRINFLLRDMVLLSADEHDVTTRRMYDGQKE